MVTQSNLAKAYTKFSVLNLFHLRFIGIRLLNIDSGVESPCKIFRMLHKRSYVCTNAYLTFDLDDEKIFLTSL